MPYLMKCGHIAQGVAEDGSPVCVICAGIKEEAYQVDRGCCGAEGLENRVAKCIYGCGSKRNSSWELPFFEYKPECEYDYFYCGCGGWD